VQKFGVFDASMEADGRVLLAAILHTFIYKHILVAIPFIIVLVADQETSNLT
jgi:hypothetical protein